MDYLLSDQEWCVLSPFLGSTKGDSRARAGAEACLYRHCVQMAKRYCTFGWDLLPPELGISGNTANRRFVRWNESGQWLQFWDALIELRHGPAIPEKPDKAISRSNSHQSLILELERAYRFFNRRFAAGELPLSVAIDVEVGGNGHRGYLAPNYWKVADMPAQHHLAVSASTVNGGNVAEALGTLLHEMAHLRNVSLRISDTDPNTQYHRQDFRDSALLFGLSCGPRDTKRGFAATELAARGHAAIRRLKPVAEVFQWRRD